MAGVEKFMPSIKYGAPFLLQAPVKAPPANSDNSRSLMILKYYFFLIFFSELLRSRLLSLNNLDISFCLRVGFSLDMVIYVSTIPLNSTAPLTHLLR
jgi:hypothetical protein